MKSIGSNKCMKPKLWGVIGYGQLERRANPEADNEEWEGAGRRCWNCGLCMFPVGTTGAVEFGGWVLHFSKALKLFFTLVRPLLSTTHTSYKTSTQQLRGGSSLGGCCLSLWQHFVQMWAVWYCWTSLELCDQTLLIISMSNPTVNIWWIWWNVRRKLEIVEQLEEENVNLPYKREQNKWLEL